MRIVVRYNRRKNMNTTAPPDSFVETAIVAADAARAVTAKYFRAGVAVTDKDDRTPVTVADRDTEARIREVILARHPTHGFVGEEGGVSSHVNDGGDDDDDDGNGNGIGDGDGNRNGDEWRWVIDPIDGTKSFATGKPTFGTLIALLHHGRPVIGVVDHAALDERWLGIADRATTYNGDACATGDASQLATATIYATTPDMFAGESAARFAHLCAAFRFRVFGGDCYCYGLLASGYTDAVCEAQMKPHDFMALVPVVEGAGGVITDWRGDALTFDSDGSVLATANEKLHRLAVDRLNENL